MLSAKRSLMIIIYCGRRSYVLRIQTHHIYTRIHTKLITAGILQINAPAHSLCRRTLRDLQYDSHRKQSRDRPNIGCSGACRELTR